MDLLIFASSLGYSRRIDDELFVRNTINKFQPHITLLTKYLALIIIECKLHYISLKKKLQNLEHF